MHRRPLAALLAALVAGVAVLVVPGPEAVRAATSGTAGIVADPPCIAVNGNSDSPVSTVITVRGHGFEPGSTVEIYAAEIGTESFLPPLDTQQVDDLGSFRGSVPLGLPGSATSFQISAQTQGGNGIQADATVPAPCAPSLVVTPTCTAPDAPFDISFAADGFSPGATMQVGIIVPDGMPQIVSDRLAADDQGHLEYILTGVGPLPAGRYQAVAAEGSARAITARSRSTNLVVAQAPIELPCATPQIALDPDCAPAGAPQHRYDVTVTGVGFLYGPAVITWDVGGSAEEFRIEQIGDNGTFSARIDPWQRARGSRIKVRVTQSFPYQSGDVASDPLLGRFPTATNPPRVAQASFRVPCRPQATPVMGLDPDCDSPALTGDAERRYAIGVSASGLTPGPVDIVFDAGAVAADVTPPEHFPGEVGKDGQLVPVSITPLARPVGEYGVSLLQREAVVIERVFRVPCEKPTAVVRPLQPTCGPIAPGVVDSYSIRVRGRGFYPGAIELTLDRGGTPDALMTTVRADGTFDEPLSGTGRDRGAYTVLARQRDARGTVLRGSRTFTVPCVEPTLTIEPRSGPAGYATLVTGTDFPPRMTVTLTWDQGITAGTPMDATADASGTFTMSIFLLPHDIPGPRVLTAGTPTDPNAFPDVTADYLVVEGSGQPPGVPGDPGSMIFRR